MMQEPLPRARRARHFLRRRLRGALVQTRDMLDRRISRLEDVERRLRSYAAPEETTPGRPPPGTGQRRQTGPQA